MAAVIGAYMVYLNSRLPSIDQLAVIVPNETTKLFSRDGIMLAELHEEENRIWMPLEQINPIIQKAVIGLEDVRFYEHHGLDFRRIFVAAVIDVLHGGAVQGASTITQQLARNVFLTKQKTLTRKLSEVIMATQIERKYTKNEILEMYLNQVYWGHNAYGIESASQLYFGKHASDLNLAEAAMVVGLLRGPELFTPYRHMANAKARQNVVLSVMRNHDIITEVEYQQAKATPIVLRGLRTHRYRSPYFSEYVVRQLEEMYGRDTVYSAGLKVYTTLDYQLDTYAHEIITQTLEETNHEFYVKEQGKVPSLNVNQGALMAMDPRTGYILTMQGGKDFTSTQFNRCFQAMRQPGSAFKPFVYLTALSRGFSPGSFIYDTPITFQTFNGPYVPINYTKKFLGPIPIRKALEQSVNVVAIKLNDLMGPAAVVQTAKALGISTPILPVLSLPLGANEVTMIDMLRAYGCIANSGKMVDPIAILRVEDRNGVEIYRHRIHEKPVFDANTIHALVDIMKGVVLYGTGRAANLPRPMAGKTGTTNDYRDAWFFGFTPQLVAAAWVGNDDNVPMNSVTGGWWPARMWRLYMKKATDGMPVLDFPRPYGMIDMRMCWEEGKLARPECPEFREDSEGKQVPRVTTEKFWNGRQPKDYCTIHDPANPQPATGERQITSESEDEPWMEDFFQ